MIIFMSLFGIWLTDISRIQVTRKSRSIQSNDQFRVDFLVSVLALPRPVVRDHESISSNTFAVCSFDLFAAEFTRISCELMRVKLNKQT